MCKEAAFDAVANEIGEVAKHLQQVISRARGNEDLCPDVRRLLIADLDNQLEELVDMYANAKAAAYIQRAVDSGATVHIVEQLVDPRAARSPLN